MADIVTLMPKKMRRIAAVGAVSFFAALPFSRAMGAENPQPDNTSPASHAMSEKDWDMLLLSDAQRAEVAAASTRDNHVTAPKPSQSPASNQTIMSSEEWSTLFLTDDQRAALAGTHSNQVAALPPSQNPAPTQNAASDNASPAEKHTDSPAAKSAASPPLPTSWSVNITPELGRSCSPSVMPKIAFVDSITSSKSGQVADANAILYCERNDMSTAVLRKELGYNGPFYFILGSDSARTHAPLIETAAIETLRNSPIVAPGVFVSMDGTPIAVGMDQPIDFSMADHARIAQLVQQTGGVATISSPDPAVRLASLKPGERVNTPLADAIAAKTATEASDQNSASSDATSAPSPQQAEAPVVAVAANIDDAKRKTDTAASADVQNSAAEARAIPAAYRTEIPASAATENPQPLNQIYGKFADQIRALDHTYNDDDLNTLSVNMARQGYNLPGDDAVMHVAEAAPEVKAHKNNPVSAKSDETIADADISKPVKAAATQTAPKPIVSTAASGAVPPASSPKPVEDLSAGQRATIVADYVDYDRAVGTFAGTQNGAELYDIENLVQGGASVRVEISANGEKVYLEDNAPDASGDIAVGDEYRNFLIPRLQRFFAKNFGRQIDFSNATIVLHTDNPNPVQTASGPASKKLAPVASIPAPEQGAYTEAKPQPHVQIAEAGMGESGGALAILEISLAAAAWVMRKLKSKGKLGQNFVKISEGSIDKEFVAANDTGIIANDASGNPTIVPFDMAAMPAFIKLGDTPIERKVFTVASAEEVARTDVENRDANRHHVLPENVLNGELPNILKTKFVSPTAEDRARARSQAISRRITTARSYAGAALNTITEAAGLANEKTRMATRSYTGIILNTAASFASETAMPATMAVAGAGVNAMYATGNQVLHHYNTALPVVNASVKGSQASSAIALSLAGENLAGNLKQLGSLVSHYAMGVAAMWNDKEARKTFFASVGASVATNIGILALFGIAASIVALPVAVTVAGMTGVGLAAGLAGNAVSNIVIAKRTGRQLEKGWFLGKGNRFGLLLSAGFGLVGGHALGTAIGSIQTAAATAAATAAMHAKQAAAAQAAAHAKQMAAQAALQAKQVAATQAALHAKQTAAQQTVTADPNILHQATLQAHHAKELSYKLIQQHDYHGALHAIEDGLKQIQGSGLDSTTVHQLVRDDKILTNILSHSLKAG